LHNQKKIHPEIHKPEMTQHERRKAVCTVSTFYMFLIKKL